MSERLVLLNTNYSNHNPENGDIPPTEEAILEFIGKQREHEDEPGKTTVVLIDTIWKKRFGEDDPRTGRNKKLANHLGMNAAFHTLIDDEELSRNDWKQHIGITVATDHEVSDSRIVRLGTGEKARNGLVLDLALGSRGLTLAAFYPPETNSNAQMEQISALSTVVNGEQIIPRAVGPQILATDLNAIDRHANYKGFLPRLGSTLVRQAATIAENAEEQKYWHAVALSLDRRLVVPRLREWDYIDHYAGSTYPSWLPLLNPDHIYSHDVQKIRIQTTGKGLSDHLGLEFNFKVK